jgi:ABC-2 type transport system permease protein
MVPLRRIYVSEMWKLSKRPMTWALGAILVGFIVLIYAMLLALLVGPEAADIDREGLTESLVLPDGLFMGIGLIQLLVSALVIVLAAGMVGSDLSWGTIRTMIMMGSGRIQILVAKALTLVTFALTAIIIGMLLTVGASWVIGVATGDGPSGLGWLTGAFLADAVAVAGRALVAVSLWAIISAAITLTLRSLAAGIGITLTLSFVGGQIGGLLGQFGDAGTWAARVLPNAGIDALGQLNQVSPPDYGAGDWAWIVTSIIGWFLLMAIASVITFRRMDTLAAGS